jgi:hypothetical protein
MLGTLLVGLACLALGLAAGLRLGRVISPQPSGGDAAPQKPSPIALPAGGADPGPAATLISLLGAALRDPLQALRRVERAPPELIAQFERVTWQARMLATGARPMQALPCSPVALLEEAAQEVETLRLGKVQASWTLLTRQPVYVDPERTRSAFRELFTAGAALAGEAGRLAVRITPGERETHPVRIEIEIGQRGTEMDALAAGVARHLLEAQGALFEQDGPVVRIWLRKERAQPLGGGPYTPSNR